MRHVAGQKIFCIRSLLYDQCTLSRCKYISLFPSVFARLCLAPSYYPHRLSSCLRCNGKFISDPTTNERENKVYSRAPHIAPASVTVLPLLASVVVRRQPYSKPCVRSERPVALATDLDTHAHSELVPTRGWYETPRRGLSAREHSTALDIDVLTSGRPPRMSRLRGRRCLGESWAGLKSRGRGGGGVDSWGGRKSGWRRTVVD